MYLLLLVVVLIVHGSLNPWHFDFARTATNPFLAVLQSWPDRWDSNAIQDAVVNVALYAPLGIAAFRVAARKHATGAAAATAICVGLTLSMGLELLQVYVPDRVGSICDVLFNVAGTVVGTLLAHRYRVSIEATIDWIRRHGYARLGSPPGLLLACWTIYQLYPLVIHIRPGSLSAAVVFILHPRGYDPNSPYWAEILIATAEWFAVGLAMQSLFDGMRPYWILLALCFRLLVRPYIWTAPFGVEDFLGAALAFLLWVGLRERIRRDAGLAMLGAGMLLRQLAPLHFSHLPHSFSPIGDAFRRAFDCGALVWVMSSEGESALGTSVLVAASLTCAALLHRYLTGSFSLLSDPVLAAMLALGLWFRNVFGTSATAT